MSTSNSLRLDQISVYANQKPLLQQVDLELQQKTIYTVIGPSGTGKSTLLNLLAGLISHQDGFLTLAGAAYLPQKHLIGLVPQNYGLLPWETAWKTVVSSVLISKKKKRLTPAEKTALKQLFARMKLEGLEQSYPAQMSGGQQQRVSLARAFAIDSELLLLDEPFSALDAFTRETAQELFLENWQRHPVTAVFITHDIEEALLLGHKIVIMKGQPGKVARVSDNPFAALPSLAEKRAAPEFFAEVSRLRKEIQS